ncbi:hypothetical protein PS710_01734 [Pseudomonas fluorescens]|uniref:Uncharacterized protein n=2 Tax=Pseudomonas fluorescens TaxID=294 RepID=A0A5E7BL89_PSEFL|nr:hypothetical protein PS710_01734 [Pseudomonas fluorescens]
MRSSLLSVLSALGLLITLPAFASSPPSIDQIKAWTPVDQSAMGITVNKLVPVTLKGDEQAYLASVSYAESARNGWAGYILVRPSLKQARALEEFGGQYNEITPVNSYSPSQSALIIGASASGQGSSESTYSLVVFDGWNAKTLYSVSESDNSGQCGPEIETYCKGNNAFINVLSIPAPTGKLALAITNISYSSPDLAAGKPKISQEIQVVFVENPHQN